MEQDTESSFHLTSVTGVISITLYKRKGLYIDNVQRWFDMPLNVIIYHSLNRDETASFIPVGFIVRS